MSAHNLNLASVALFYASIIFLTGIGFIFFLIESRAILMPSLKRSSRRSGGNRTTKKQVTQMESVKMEPANTHHIESAKMEPDATEIESEKIELDATKMESIEIEPDDRLKSHTVKVVKVLWSKREDAKLKRIVDTMLETIEWPLVSTQILSRSPKQCRERWFNHLRPNLKKGSWTKEDDKQIVELQSVHGNRWTVIASHLPGRTDNDIKNRWHSAVRSKARINASHNTCAPVSITAHDLNRGRVKPSQSTQRKKRKSTLKKAAQSEIKNESLIAVVDVKIEENVSNYGVNNELKTLPDKGRATTCAGGKVKNGEMEYADTSPSKERHLPFAPTHHFANHLEKYSPNFSVEQSPLFTIASKNRSYADSPHLIKNYFGTSYSEAIPLSENKIMMATIQTPTPPINGKYLQTGMSLSKWYQKDASTNATTFSDSSSLISNSTRGVALPIIGEGNSNGQPSVGV